MRLYYGDELPGLAGSVVALGMFDGCHGGHRMILSSAARMAKKLGCPSVAYTYLNHPLSLLHPAAAPAKLQSDAQRVAAISACGIDMLCLRRFTREEADTEPDAFIDRLCGRLGMRGMVLGHSATFGRGGRGTPAMLQSEGARRGFAVKIARTLSVGGERVTSSAIRQHLQEGRADRAAALLGRCYSLGGAIQKGRQLGGSIGFPTINVALEEGRLLPRFGVYAGWADIGESSHPCVINLGIKPTIGLNDVTLEAFLLNFRGDLYGKHAEIRFFAYLRGEQRFADLDALRAQIRRDVAGARQVLG